MVKFKTLVEFRGSHDEMLHAATKSDCQMADALPGTDVETFYKNKSILITGASGFLGKTILEKLLRSFSMGPCGRIYLLIRGNSVEDVEKRLMSEVMGSEIFVTLRQLHSDFDTWFRDRVIAVRGDMTCERLGLTPEDYSTLTTKANIIIHSAASVMFDEPLNQVLEKNVLGSERVFDVAKDCRGLECMVYVSSMAPNCNQPCGSWIEEKIYMSDRSGVPFNAQHELASILAMSSAEVEAKTKAILSQWPNTYCYSKFLSEHLLASGASDFGVPLVICRPSMVAAALREPVPGWVDSKVGLGSGLLAMGSGLKSMWHCNASFVPDVIPVDICANIIILSAARRPALLHHSLQRLATSHNPFAGKVPVVMVGSSTMNPVTWEVISEKTVDFFTAVPMSRQLARPGVRACESQLACSIYTALAYEAPSLLFSVARGCGHSRLQNLSKMLTWRAKQNRRLDELLGPFARTAWNFESRVTREVFLAPGSSNAPHLLPVDVRDIAWEAYIMLNCYGLQRYVMKDWGEDQQLNAETHGMLPETLAIAAVRGGVEVGRNCPTIATRANILSSVSNVKTNSKERRIGKAKASSAARVGGFLAMAAVLLLLAFMATSANAVWFSQRVGALAVDRRLGVGSLAGSESQQASHSAEHQGALLKAMSANGSSEALEA